MTLSLIRQQSISYAAITLLATGRTTILACSYFQRLFLKRKLNSQPTIMLNYY